MRKASMFLVLALGLTACNPDGMSFGAQTQVVPGLATAGLIDLTQEYGKETGTYLGYRSEITQPTLKFSVAPGSLGVTVTSYTVEVLDSAGSRFGGNDASYSRNGLSFRVPGGYACPTGDTDQCAGADKTAVARQVAFPDSVALIKQGVVEQLNQNYYVADECENLSMRISFRGFDDLNRSWSSPAFTNADIGTECNRELVEEQP